MKRSARWASQPQQRTGSRKRTNVEGSRLRNSNHYILTSGPGDEMKQRTSAVALDVNYREYAGDLDICADVRTTKPRPKTAKTRDFATYNWRLYKSNSSTPCSDVQYRLEAPMEGKCDHRDWQGPPVRRSSRKTSTGPVQRVLDYAFI